MKENIITQLSKLIPLNGVTGTYTKFIQGGTLFATVGDSATQIGQTFFLSDRKATLSIYIFFLFRALWPNLPLPPPSPTAASKYLHWFPRCRVASSKLLPSFFFSQESKILSCSKLASPWTTFHRSISGEGRSVQECRRCPARPIPGEFGSRLWPFERNANESCRCYHYNRINNAWIFPTLARSFNGAATGEEVVQWWWSAREDDEECDRICSRESGHISIRCPTLRCVALVCPNICTGHTPPRAGGSFKWN